VADEPTARCLQWRDRAGFTPASLFTRPSWRAPQDFIMTIAAAVASRLNGEPGRTRDLRSKRLNRASHHQPINEKVDILARISVHSRLIFLTYSIICQQSRTFSAPRLLQSRPDATVRLQAIS
jgi:hypothetical protein